MFTVTCYHQNILESVFNVYDSLKRYNFPSDVSYAMCCSAGGSMFANNAGISYSTLIQNNRMDDRMGFRASIYLK